MTGCTHRYSVEGSDRPCPRSSVADHDRCVFHLSPEERRATDASAAALCTAFLAEVDADDPDRREYVDVHLTDLDRSALVVDGSDVGSIPFRRVTVDGTLDRSGAVVRHPLVVEDGRIAGLDLTRASFELAVVIEGTTFGGAGGPATRCRPCHVFSWRRGFTSLSVCNHVPVRRPIFR